MRNSATPTRVAIAIVAAIAAAVSLGGCVQASREVIPTSDPSVKPVFASNAEALAAAEKAYAAYLSVSDQILIDGGANPQRLLSVAKPAEYRTQLSGFLQESSNHWRSTGKTVIDEIELQGYSPQARNGVGIVTVYACLDVSQVDVINSAGVSVVSSTRPNRSAFQAAFDLATKHSSKLILASETPWQGAEICS
jgi:hypothetical protein